MVWLRYCGSSAKRSQQKMNAMRDTCHGLSHRENIYVDGMGKGKSTNAPNSKYVAKKVHIVYTLLHISNDHQISIINRMKTGLTFLFFQFSIEKQVHFFHTPFDCAERLNCKQPFFPLDGLCVEQHKYNKFTTIQANSFTLCKHELKASLQQQ